MQTNKHQDDQMGGGAKEAAGSQKRLQVSSNSWAQDAESCCREGLAGNSFWSREGNGSGKGFSCFKVRDWYLDSFRHVRSFPEIKDRSDKLAITEMIKLAILFLLLLMVCFFHAPTTEHLSSDFFA